MYKQFARCDVAAGDVQQVFVVREEYDLGAVGQFGQHLQGGGGTSVVGGVAPWRGACEAVVTLDLARLDRLLRVDPEPWTVEDSLAIGQLMVRRWGEGGGMELTFTSVLVQLIQRNGILNGWKIFNDACPQIDPGATTTIQSNETIPSPRIPLFPPLLPSTQDILEAAQHILSLDAQEQEFCEAQGLLYHFGSNGWVVAPEKSETENAMLLGGPQMGHSIPQIVVEVGMHGAGMNTSGMTFPGVGPAIAIGANSYGAWTTTSGLSDGVDTYIEILHPFNKTKYRYNGQWYQMENRTEIIYD